MRDLSFYRDFAAEAHGLSQGLLFTCQRLPEALRRAVLSYPTAAGVSEEALAADSIYFLLPFWVQRDLGRDVDEPCRKVAHANACLAYCVLIQDRLMDRGGDAGAALMAGNALLLSACRGYGQIFPADSPFWARCEPLLLASWAALLGEQRRGAAEALRVEEVAVQTAKINAGKVAAGAIALLCGRPEAMVGLDAYLDHWQLACQGQDDLLDWREDLAAGHATRLLALALAEGTQARAQAKVEAFLGRREGILPYLDQVLGHYEQAHKACPRADGYLAAFVSHDRAVTAAQRAAYERLFNILSL